MVIGHGPALTGWFITPGPGRGRPAPCQADHGNFNNNLLITFKLCWQSNSWATLQCLCQQFLMNYLINWRMHSSSKHQKLFSGTARQQRLGSPLHRWRKLSIKWNISDLIWNFSAKICYNIVIVVSEHPNHNHSMGHFLLFLLPNIPRYVGRTISIWEYFPHHFSALTVFWQWL